MDHQHLLFYTLILFYFLDHTLSKQGKISLWISNIKGYSSQYDPSSHSAHRIVGSPDVYPKYGSIPGAWAQHSLTDDQYVEVGIVEKLYIEKIDIYETFIAGGVKEIEALDPVTGQWELVWNTSKVEVITHSRIFSPSFQKLDFPTDVLRITVDCTAAHNYVEIDAIKVTGTLDPPETTCSPGYLHYNGSCYMIGRTNETWVSAENFCRAMGGHLAEIESHDEDVFLRIHFLDVLHNDKHKDVNYWIGGTDAQREGQWIWVTDHAPITYKDFNAGQPDNADGVEHCLRMSGLHDFRWEDAQCGSQALFVCEEKDFLKYPDPSSIVG